MRRVLVATKPTLLVEQNLRGKTCQNKGEQEDSSRFVEEKKDRCGRWCYEIYVQWVHAVSGESG